MGAITKIEQQLAVYSPDNYIMKLEEGDLLGKCAKMISKAITYKGLSKKDVEDVAALATLLCEALTDKFSHVSFKLIYDTLYKNNFGENFGISIAEWVKILNTEGIADTHQNNKKALLLAEVDIDKEKEERQRQAYEELVRTGQIKQIIAARCQTRYSNWVERGSFFDLDNETYCFIRKDVKYIYDTDELLQAEYMATKKFKEEIEREIKRLEYKMQIREAKEKRPLLSATAEDLRKIKRYQFWLRYSLTEIYFRNFRNQQKYEKANENAED